MLKRMEELAFRALLHPRVSHRLPGRLRLQIPLLRRVPEDWGDIVTLFEEVGSAPDGIHELSTDQRSGSLLVAYDPEALQEADVTTYVQSLLDLLFRHRRQFARVSRADAARLSGKLKHWLQAHTRLCPRIAADTEIPDEIWT